MTDPAKPFNPLQNSQLSLDLSYSSAPSAESKSASPLGWLLNPKKSVSADGQRAELQTTTSEEATDRILARLVQLEAHEVNPHLKDDYRQSFITLTLASRGNTMPFVVASYQMYGVHPDKLWPSIVARRQAMLGQPKSILAQRVEPTEAGKPLPPSVKPASVSILERKKA